MPGHTRNYNSELIANSTHLAIGLAAVDGLTCAFVAMLALALALQGGETVVPSRFNTCSGKIVFSQMADSASARVLLSLYVKATLNGTATSGTVSPVGGDNFFRSGRIDVVRQDGQPLLKNVLIQWNDCRTNSCFNFLSITGAPPGSQWRIVIRAANTVGELADQHPHSARIDALSEAAIFRASALDVEHGMLAYRYNCSDNGKASFTWEH